jgi:intracellular sulfur oxidation DsrE/DsrF family protein
MFSLKDTIHRRGFLGSIAATTAVGVAALSSSPMELLAQKGKPDASNNKEFEAWLKKIKGKHRQVFDATAPNEGMPFIWPRVFMMTNKEVGVPDNDVTTVIILRHDAIPFALDHPMWEKYKLGEFFKIEDKATKAPAVRNTYYHPKSGELMMDSFAIDELQKDGVLFGACNMAIKVLGGIVAKSMNMDPDVAVKDWTAAVLPGIQIVPSGVLAVNRAQEHGCAYCYAGG